MNLLDARKQSRIALAIKGFLPNELQVMFRDGFYDEKLVEYAIVDALVEQGDIAAWNSDGVGCVAQMIRAQHDRAERLRGQLGVGAYRNTEVARLNDKIAGLENEIDRLNRGDFTPEEFQNLCHNFSENDKQKFFEGCREYQKKLFGESDCKSTEHQKKNLESE